MEGLPAARSGSPKEPVLSAAAQFDIPGRLLSSKRFGSGLINDTWICIFAESGSERWYILQRINTSVFANPVQVMENVEIVTRHIADKLKAEGIADPFSAAPMLIRTRTGWPYFIDENGGFWRAFHYIQSSEVYDTVPDRRVAREVGRGLGRFQRLVSDLPAHLLHNTLPGFHHTPAYLKAFDEAVKADVKKRLAGARAEAAFVDIRRHIAPILFDAMNSGSVPIRVVHNDPKVNNILISTETREVICMIDLDTVKPGITAFDFGDCVRSAANSGGEDAANFSAVRFSLDIFDAVAGGYLSEAGGFLTKNETALLPDSVKVITFELGLRFLTDYLRGDVYFNIKYPGQNLHRARVQFLLLEQVEKAEKEMQDIMAGHVRRMAGKGG